MAFSPTTFQAQVDTLGNPIEATNSALVTLTSSNTAQAVKAAPGRLVKLTVITALAGAGGVLEVWDNASAGSGTPLFALPVSNTTLNVGGTVIPIGVAALNGIYVTNASGTITSGAVAIAYS
jgi:hypothetical protein